MEATARRVIESPDPARYPIDWVENDSGMLVPKPHGLGDDAPAITWCPQYGSQVAALSASKIFEVLMEGNRGPGKTDWLLMDFAQHVGKGYGREWRGVLFRQTFPQLADVINKSQKLFKGVFPAARYNQSEHVWTFPDGEQLFLRHMMRQSDYWNFHGHAYPWIGWEELCNWPDDKCYRVMMSCSRSTAGGDMPRCYRATTNPYGPGHNWVKSRFRLPQARGKVITNSMRDGKPEPPRVAIHARVWENQVLLHADPDYMDRIRAAARNPSELRAWLYGDWNIVAGGMFDDLWRDNVHKVPDFPLHMIPRGWRIDRSFDWGSSKPFAVLWWAESNGEPIEWNGYRYGTRPGDLYQIMEWYGWNGQRNEGVRMLASDIARGIKDREQDAGLIGRVKPGPADSSIFDVENGSCIAKDMERLGVKWNPADKSPGSRKQGWEQIRKMLKAALPKSNTPREEPGLYFLQSNEQTFETLPNLPRSDKDLDDVNTEAEDHIGDAVRYRVRRKLRGVQQANG